MKPFDPLPVYRAKQPVRIRIFIIAVCGLLTSLHFMQVEGHAQSPALFGGGGSPLDSKEPIDIAADVLDVDQQKQVAVFTGNVDAVQGDLHLRSDVLTVYYDSSDEGQDNKAPKKPKEKDGASAIGGSGDIRKIRVTGNVVIISPEETATGDWALYDVASGKVTMGGDVVLTRGENILKGQKLIVDLETGKSKLEAAPNGKGDETRIRGLLIPKKDTKEDENQSPDEDQKGNQSNSLTGAITE